MAKKTAAASAPKEQPAQTVQEQNPPAGGRWIRQKDGSLKPFEPTPAAPQEQAPDNNTETEKD